MTKNQYLINEYLTVRQLRTVILEQRNMQVMCELHNIRTPSRLKRDLATLRQDVDKVLVVKSQVVS